MHFLGGKVSDEVEPYSDCCFGAGLMRILGTFTAASTFFYAFIQKEWKATGTVKRFEEKERKGLMESWTN